MRQVDYEREDGRWFRVLLPDEAPDSDAPAGIPIGPPEFDSLSETWPPGTLTRLHNELFHRGILTFRDAVRHRQDIVNAIQRALALDVETVMIAYQEEEEDAGTSGQ